LGDWPYYILVEELLIFPFFIVIFYGFKAADYLSDRYRGKQVARSRVQEVTRGK
jgi:uncharacterized membrane protein YwaF